MQEKDIKDKFVPKSYKEGTGIDVYDRHTADNLTSAKGVTSRNEQLLLKLPRVYNNPDIIRVSDHKDVRGRETIVFEKRINGIILVVNAISCGKQRLALDTMYIKKSHPTMPDADAPRALRPKRSVGKASFENSITNISSNINE